MLRSGFILGVSAPAALLTVLLQPVVRETADNWSPPVIAATASAPASLPGMRPASLALSPTRVAGVQRTESRPVPVAEEGRKSASGRSSSRRCSRAAWSVRAARPHSAPWSVPRRAA